MSSGRGKRPLLIGSTRKTPVVPAQAGTQWRTMNDAGFPPPTTPLEGRLFAGTTEYVVA
jgi:hypothetical protein